MNELILPNGQHINILDKLTAEYVYNEIYVEKEYLKNSIEIKNNNIIFDVGANIGLFTLFTLSQASNLQIFAFEPIPQIYEVLKKNLNNIEGVRLYNVGLGEKNGEKKFYYYPKVSADSTANPFEMDKKVELYVKNYNDTISKDIPIARIVPKFLRRTVVKRALTRLYEPIEVKCKIRTLSRILEENNLRAIDLLKIDAENYERQVLEGIKDKYWEKINQIVIEVHEHIKGGENLTERLINLLQKKNFKVYRGKKETRESLLGVYMIYALKN